jgi:3-phosphoshikimate 1-carboxyvinyltransferase
VSASAAPADVYRVVPSEGPLDAVVRVPGSKSITNRALVAAALSEGPSRLEGVLFADDTEAMLSSLVALGFDLEIDRVAETVVVAGRGGAVPDGPTALDARASGTTSRFLIPLLALGTGPYTLDGSEQLRARPMADGLDAAATLGARVTDLGQPGHLPVRIAAAPGGASAGAEVRVHGSVSSQFLSGLLLAAPCLPRGLTVLIDGELVSRPYVDMTIAVMTSFGAEVSWPDETSIRVAATGYRGRTYAIEPDASAASYFFAAPAIVGGRVTVEGLGTDAVQGDVQFVDALELMGATVERAAGSITVTGGDGLLGVDVDFTDISDTAQTLAAVAAFADGATTVTGIGFIRRKETDRIAAVVHELRACGVDADELADGFRVTPGPVHAARVRTYEDHRMAMSFALLGLRVAGIEIEDPGCVAKTFPTFWSVLESLRTGGNAGSRVPRS